MEDSHNGEHEARSIEEEQRTPNSHRTKAQELRKLVSQARIDGDPAVVERNVGLADVEDALGEFDERYSATERAWLEDGWHAGKEWKVVTQIHDQTVALEKQVVLEGQDPKNVDRLRRSNDPEEEHGLRVARLRLGQFQKLQWRAEILAELGQEIIDAEAARSELPAYATDVGRTTGALDYRDEMLAKWRSSRGGESS